MKKLLFVFLLAFASLAQAWDQRSPLAVEACQVHNPYGWAQSARKALPICREAYFVAFDPPAKIPIFNNKLTLS